jgi:NADH-quinone oxidoreductase subunit M
MPIETTNALGLPVLSLTIFLPLIGALVILVLPRRHGALYHATGLFFSGTTLVLASILFRLFQWSPTEFAVRVVFQFVDPPRQPLAWLPGGITYQVGVDGLSIGLFWLTALLSFLALLYSWSSVRHRPREYVALMLVLETGLLGVFCALDLFLFYIFWEVVLIPMALLIAIWGGAGRLYASLKFVIYTMAGSALMLVAIVAVGVISGAGTTNLLELLPAAAVRLAPSTQAVLFLALAIAFAVKVPLFPFHTWLPDAHVEAPTAGSVILAGVLLKMGTYGFVRLAMPLFPAVATQAVPWIMALAIIGIWYGAWVAFAQKDAKSLVAYSSVSHLGIVMVGLFALNAQGMAGGTLQMLNHGISTGALFLLVGMLYERAHSRDIADFGGLWAQMPRFSGLFLVVLFASVALPGTNGFVGEWLALLGAFRSQMIYGALAAFGVVLGAAYLLWLYQRVFFGPPEAPEAELPDLTAREVLVLAPLVVLIFWIGIYPETFLGPIAQSSQAWVTLINAAGHVLAGR